MLNSTDLTPMCSWVRAAVQARLERVAGLKVRHERKQRGRQTCEVFVCRSDGEDQQVEAAAHSERERASSGSRDKGCSSCSLAPAFNFSASSRTLTGATQSHKRCRKSSLLKGHLQFSDFTTLHYGCGGRLGSLRSATALSVPLRPL